MKRTALTLILILVISGAFAQSAKVVSAYNYMKPQYNELDKAKESIDQAAQHPKTSMDAKTWYYRGQVYYKLYQSTDEKFANLDDNPLLVAYKSFVKAKELDVKGRYEKDLLFEIQRIASNIFNKGIDEFEQQKYERSLESYETVIELGRLPYINQVDTAAFYNAALAADQAGKFDKAIEYYLKTAEFGYEGSKVYKYIADIYMTKGDTVAALDSYKKGIEAYPEDNVALYIELINFYLVKGDLDQAQGFIEKALEKDSKNASLWYVYGLSMEKKDDERALEAFIKATEINPEYYDAFYMAGLIHFNRGVEANKVEQEIPLNDTEGYELAKEKTNSHFLLSLPYFEKALLLNVDDSATLDALKQLYYRFKMTEKLEEVTKLIDSLK